MMAISVSELQEMRDTLVRNRAKGVRSLEQGGEKVQFGSDLEMAKAISDLDRQIDAASRPPIRTVKFSTSKGA